MIKVYHVNKDLDHSLRLTVTDPLVPNFEAAMDDGTYDAKQTALRVEAARAILAARGYTLVAEVDGTDLDVAYRATNNNENSWSREPASGVRPEGLGYIVGRDQKRYGYKSSSVGDIFEDTTTGIMHVVDSYGFAAL